jgi:metal-sulfur cluster biosynthetic enzyme
VTANIVELPTAKLTPDALLDGAKRDVPNMDAIATVTLWKDGTLSVKFSQTTNANLCMMQRVFDQTVDDTLRGAEK